MLEDQDLRIVSPLEDKDEQELELTLRPQKLVDFLGQRNLVQNLEIFIQAAEERGDVLEHVLFCGPPGLGKTTLSYILANEVGSNIKTTSGPAIERTGDLASILTNLEEGDVFFIDEIHRLNRVVEEVLYSAMEDFVLDIIIGKGPSARTLRLDLPHFTLVGATTKMGLLSAPLRSRFGMNFRLRFYDDESLLEIVERSALVLDVEIESEGALEIAKRSRGTPRVANRLLKRVRDFAQVKGDHSITKRVVVEALKMMQIDENGLDNMDRQLLERLINDFEGGPVGLKTLSAITSEDKRTLEEVYEPFLIQRGFLKRTSRGRTATTKAFDLFNKKPGKEEEKLWN